MRKHYGIRTERYKLIHFYGDTDEWELYDLQNDPHEMKNLFGDEDYQKSVDQLKSELQALREKYQDTNLSM